MLYTKVPQGQTKLRDNTENNPLTSLKAQPINENQHGQTVITYAHSNPLLKNAHEGLLESLVPFFNFFLIDEKEDILIRATKIATHGIQNVYSYHQQKH